VPSRFQLFRRRGSLRLYIIISTCAVTIVLHVISNVIGMRTRLNITKHETCLAPVSVHPSGSDERDHAVYPVFRRDRYNAIRLLLLIYYTVILSDVYDIIGIHGIYIYVYHTLVLYILLCILLLFSGQSGSNNK
jgi:hypothetical protein